MRKVVLFWLLVAMVWGLSSKHISKADGIGSLGQAGTVSGSPVTLLGLAPDGASAVGSVIDTSTAYTAGTGARNLSIRNGGVEKAWIDGNGSYVGTASTTMFAAAYQSLGSTTTAIVRGGSTNNSTAVAVKLGSLTALNVSGGKIISFYPDNLVTEVAYLTISGEGRFQNLSAVSTSALGVRGNSVSGATAYGVKFGNTNALTTAGAKIVGFYNDAWTTEKLAIDLNGKLVLPTGGSADTVGRTVLVAGTATVATTVITAASVVILTPCVLAGTVGVPSLGAVVAGTSFVINSVQPGTAGTVQAADTSTICWHVMN